MDFAQFILDQDQLDNQPKPEAKRSPAGEVVTGLERGAVVQLPTMLGQGMKWVSEPGAPVYEAGESLRSDAEIRGENPGMKLQPEAHGAITKSLSSGAEMLIPSVAPQVLAAVGSVLFPPGAPYFHGMAAAGTGALFGSAQAQDSYERVLAETGDEGKARAAGWAAGSVEAGGEAVASLVGGKYITGALKILGPNRGGKIAERVLARARKPKALLNFGKATGINAATEVATEMGQNAGQVAVERAAGVTSGPTPAEAAVEAISPTLGMSALMIPLGGVGAYRANRQTKQLLSVLEDAAAPLEERSQAAAYFHSEMAKQDQGAADEWAAQTLTAIADGRPLSVVDGAGGGMAPKAKPSGPLSKAVGKGEVEPPAVVEEVPEVKEGELYDSEPVLEPAQVSRFEQSLNSLLEESMPKMQDDVVDNHTPLDANAHDAATSPTNDLSEPSQAQIEAGNYKKGHLTLHGLNIAIENPAGSLRKGVDETGRKWETELHHHYGDIKNTVGADGDALDVFIKPGIDQTTVGDRIYVVDQKNVKNGLFDEHKTLMGFESEQEAREAYLSNYDHTGPQRIGALTETTAKDFKAWLKAGKTKRAFAGQQMPQKRISYPALKQTAKAAGLTISTKQKDGSYLVSRDGNELFRAANLEELNKQLTEPLLAQSVEVTPQETAELDNGVATIEDADQQVAEDGLSGEIKMPEVLKVSELLYAEMAADGKMERQKDIHGDLTGWNKIEHDNGTLLLHPKKHEVVWFKTADAKSGTALQRARAEAQAFGMDHPVQIAGQDKEGESAAAKQEGAAQKFTPQEQYESVIDDISDADIEVLYKESIKGKLKSVDEKRAALRAADEADVFPVYEQLADDGKIENEYPDDKRFEQEEDWDYKVANFPATEKNVNVIKAEGKEYISLEVARERLAHWKAEAKRIGQEEDNSNKVIISLFDESGEISKPWRDAGYDVRQYDIKLGDDLLKYVPMAEIIELKESGKKVVGVIAQPPCTTFTVSGTRWWKERHDKHDRAMVNKMFGPFAAEYFSKPKEYTKALVSVVDLIVGETEPEFWAMENPVGRIASELGLPKYSLYFHPHNYGDTYTKQTMLWGKFNQDLPTANVHPSQGSLMHKLWSTAEKKGGARSITPEGFAYAFFVANHKTAKAQAVSVDSTVENQTDADNPAFKDLIEAARDTDLSAATIRDAANFIGVRDRALRDQGLELKTEAGAVGDELWFRTVFTRGGKPVYWAVRRFVQRDGRTELVLSLVESFTEDKSGITPKLYRAEVAAAKARGLFVSTTAIDDLTRQMFIDLFGGKPIIEESNQLEVAYPKVKGYTSGGAAYLKGVFDERDNNWQERNSGFSDEKGDEARSLGENDRRNPRSEAEGTPAAADERGTEEERLSDKTLSIGDTFEYDGIDLQLESIDTDGIHAVDPDSGAVESWADATAFTAATGFSITNSSKIVDSLKKEDVSSVESVQQDNEQSGGSKSVDVNKQDSKPVVTQEAKKVSDKTAVIEDFGEVLHGARKHYAEKLVDAAKLDTATSPLSKTWPEPNYTKLIESGIDSYVVSMVRAMREEVPTKGRSGWKVKRYVESVELLRGFSQQLLSGEINREHFSAALDKSEFSRLKSTLTGKAKLYQIIGHDHSLKDISLNAGSYSVYKGERFNPAKTIWTVERKGRGGWPEILVEGDSRDAVLDTLKEKAPTLFSGEKKPRKVKFDIYTKRRDKEKRVYIGKTFGRDTVDFESFATLKEARVYLVDHQQDLVDKLEKLKRVPNERKENNSPRVGVDHRQGQDATAEMFAEEFGFRGVQFGNYVEQKKRQRDLNNAYDALMDMAGVIGIPTRAISLNGELGLAFGARGKGGKGAAAAHYEPGTMVINLTKRSGAGSLAHELWHAMDNYFGRQHGSGSYMTQSRNSHSEASGARPEIVAAFNAIRDAIEKTDLRKRSSVLDRTKKDAYWSTYIEMSARTFENFIIEKLHDNNGANDYLANIVSQKYWDAAAALGLEKDNSYPYLISEEIPDVKAAFQDFFNTVETKETDKGVALYSIASKSNIGSQTVMLGDSGLGKIKVGSSRSLPFVRRMLEREGLEQVSVKGGNVEALRDVAKKFGKTLVFFKEQGSTASSGRDTSVPVSSEFDRKGKVRRSETATIGGFVHPERSDIIYLNVDSVSHLLFVQGHELSHTLRLEDPKLWQEMATELRPLVQRWGEYRETLSAEHYAGMSEDDQFEELLGDVIGQNFLNEQFWQEMAQQNVALFRKIARKAIALLQKALRILAGRPDVSHYISDMEQARAIISKTLLQYGHKAQAGMYEKFAAQQDNDYLAQRVDGHEILQRLRESGLSDEMLTKAFAGVKFAAAWHGTPHDVDKFSTDKIGTGEGAQAYGHGLYFARNRDVAEWYQDKLSRNDMLNTLTIDGESVSPYLSDPIQSYALISALSDRGNVEKTLSRLRGKSQDSPITAIRKKAAAAIAFLEKIDAVNSLKQDIKGNLYQVELAPKEDEYLLWDKPLDKQSAAVQGQIEKITGELSEKFISDTEDTLNADFGEWSGAELYRALTEWASESPLGNANETTGDLQRDVSGYLQSLGIAGIKYLDGSSRSKGEGNYNYVIFDEADVEITAKYSINSAAKVFTAKLTPDKAGLLFETLSGMLPDRMKAAIGGVLSNPHYGSRKSKHRTVAYELALERGANANEIKHEVMATQDGYEGLEGVREYSRKMSKDEKSMLDKLLVEGDIAGQEYSAEDLAGINNPLGKPVPDVVRKAYFAFRETLAKSTETMFDRLGRLRMLPYEEGDYYQELIDLLDEDLSAKEVLSRFGVNEKVVAAYHSIRQGRKKLDEATRPFRDQPWHSTLRDAILKGLSGNQMQHEFSKTPDLVKAYQSIQKDGLMQVATAEKYKKASWYGLLEKVLTVGDDHPMLQKMELVNAYRGVKEYDSLLAELKEQWREAKGYLPRIRKDGEQHVKVFRIDEGGEFTEVWMQPAKTKFGANKLRKDVENNLKEFIPHSFDPEAKYEVVVEPNTATPEEIFMGIGSHRAIEGLLSKVFDKATDIGVIENQLVVQQQVLKILADEISARGFGRHRLSRADYLIEGYETENTPAILSQFVGGMAGWITKSEFAMRANRLMSKIPANKPQDKVWVREYVDDALKNSTYIDQWFGTLRSFAALMFLGFKASSAMLNATQNYIWGQAVLSKHTKGATRKLLKSQHDVVKDHLLIKAGKPGVLSEEERWVMEEGLRRGRSHANYVRAMAGMDDNGGVLGKGQAGVRWLTEKAMTPFQMVETYWNREPALLAAYRVFKAKGMDKHAALKQAERFVDDVHFVVGKENIPAMLRKMGPLGRTLYTFQSYTHNYLLGMISSLGKGEYGVVMRSLTALMVFGGLAAMPFGDDLDKWYRRMFGERPLRMLEKWMRDTANQYTDAGDQIADFVMHGAPALGGVNFSRSIAVNIPWFSPDDDSLAERVTGVWGGLAQKVRYAGSAASKGDYWRSAEYISPEALANILRAYRHYADGSTTMSGRPVFGSDGKQARYTAKESVIRTFGFMPLRPSKQTQARWDTMRARDYWQGRKSDVLAQLRIAKNRRAAMVLVHKFNQALREAPGGVLVPPINQQSLKMAFKARPNRREMAYQRQ